MENISTFGISAYILASRTLPVGALINKFADDVDSVGIVEAETGQAIIDLNGIVIRWTVANPLMVTIGVIPESADDQILGVICNANRASQISPSVNDSINLVVRYPNGNIRTFTDGRVISGPSAPSAKAEGRLSSSVYTYAFGDQYTLSIASALNAAASRLGVFDSALGAIGL